MIVLDGTIVNIALPHIQTDLGFSNSSLSWVVNAYALALGSLLLLGGRLGDIFGRRRMFVFGVAVFAIASLLGGLAQNEAMMLGSRVLQGVGAALASPAALALITTTFPAGKERNRAMGVYAAMSGAGAAVGLILGGALTEVDWRWTFFINVPIGLLVALLAPRFLAESERQTGRFDLPGAITGTLGLVGIVYGLTHAAEPDAGWLDPVTLVSLIAGVVLLVAFVAHRAPLRARPAADPDPGRPHPRRQPGRHAHRRRRHVRDVLLPRPLHPAGARLLAAEVRLRVPAVQRRHRRRRHAGLDPGQPRSTRAGSPVPGALLGAVGMWGFTHLTVDSTYATGLLPWILVLAFGLGLTFVPLTLTAVAGVDDEDSGAGSAALNTAQQIGGAIGLAALTTVFTSGFKDKAAELTATLNQQVQSGTMDPAQAKQAGQAIALQAQTFGSTQGFMVGAGLILVGAVLVFLGLSVKHEDLAAREAAHGAHVG